MKLTEKIKFDSLKALEVFGENFENNLRTVSDLLERRFEVKIFLLEKKLVVNGEKNERNVYIKLI